MSVISLVFPHQLFEQSDLIQTGRTVYLIEEFLFFKQYPFHKQKIAFHRQTMKVYERFLKSQGVEVVYVEANEHIADIRKLIPYLKGIGVSEIYTIDPVDYYLSKRLKDGLNAENIKGHQFESPLFINTRDDLSSYFRSDKKKLNQTPFYIDQRKRHTILIEGEDKPIGGKWTFDTENRKKYPAKKTPPVVMFPDVDDDFKEAKKYVDVYFNNHLGSLGDNKYYPSDFKSTKEWLKQFFDRRFHEFGPYEDAIVREEIILNHSILTPMLNVGLISPQTIINEAVQYAGENDVPINSLEGFVRQIIGWREFIRGVYISKGREERTRNFWGFTRKIPSSFYDGTTGIDPIDQTIKKVLKTGYCHHIERLMVLGNFMLLCEFDPDEVYQWFMELFIDSYDWVMVPNVYGMSQFADGGLMSSKPYISGSNYILKMSNYKKGEWQKTWDGLFWHFMDKQRGFFKSNPRLGMLVSMFDKMPNEKQVAHLENAQKFLEEL